MKRILSLVLVLVMLIGVMPMALAAVPTTYCSGCGQQSWVLDEEKSVAATHLNAGKEVYVCGNEACTAKATKEEPIEKLEGECADADTDGKCDVCGEAMAVTPPASNPILAVTATAGKTTLNPGETTTITLTPADTSYTVTAAWSTSSAAVANVSTAGVVTAVAEGTATITGTLNAIEGVDFENDTVSVTITVTKGGIITCANVETSGTYASLSPVLSFNGQTVSGATFSFTKLSGISTVSTASNGTYASVTRAAREIVKIRVAVTSFTVNGTAGDPTKVAPVDVLVSFYDVVNSEVTVSNGTSAFLFDDTNVFSKVVYDNSAVVTGLAKNYSITTLWSGISTWNVIELKQMDANSKVGTISYPSNALDAFDAYATNTYSYINVDGLKFSCMSKGKFELMYTLYETGVIVQTGFVTIEVQDGSYDIEYSVDFNGTLVFDEADFYTFWKNSGNTGSLSYVTFSYGTLVGDLMTANTTDAKTLLSAYKFYYNYNKNTHTSSTAYDLDLITYKPYAKASAAYTEQISFTCYGTTAGESASGVVTINVGNMKMNFKDVKTTDWFYNDVLYVYQEGIMNGTSADYFSPNSTLTRGMVVTMLYRIEGQPKGYYSTTFKDLKQDWYVDAVIWAANNGIVNGFSDTTFGPDQAITREQLAAILFRYAGYKNTSTYFVSGLTKFTDYKTVSSYAEDAMAWANYEGIINGSNNKLNPKGNATRAEAAAMFHRYLES